MKRIVIIDENGCEMELGRKAHIARLEQAKQRNLKLLRDYWQRIAKQSGRHIMS